MSEGIGKDELSIPNGLALPRTLDDVDAAFMTGLLQARGILDADNRVVSTEDSGVGMTAGYFSAIKKVKCQYASPTDAVDAFVVKTWPDMENAPKEQIADMFAKDIAAYSMSANGFYPRPKVYLADFDGAADRWALLMDDATAFGEQKLHEDEMSLDEVLHMIPKLVEVAVAWEGCHEGEKSDQLDALGVRHWGSEDNLTAFKQIMPGGAPLFDLVTSMPGSSLMSGRPWNVDLGENLARLFTNKMEAYYDLIRPHRGATCTLIHGDLRGDNLFFCPGSANYPEGWLTIDFQLLAQGPVPSDLAYLMNSGSVLPEVYAGDNRDRVMRKFYDCYMDQTELYKDYTWEQFLQEYAVMATVLFVYYVGFGANIWQNGVTGESAARVEVDGKGTTEAELAPEERRQRMWWRKAIANFRATFEDFEFHAQLQSLPDNQGDMGPWYELPERLKSS
jgi:hypothetical protein